MGEKVEAGPFTREDRTRHRQKVRTGLDALARMLTQSTFDFDRPMTGLEIELNLVDGDCEPAMRNAEVLEAIADPQFVTELGKFNIEINVAPRALARQRAELLRGVGTQRPEQRGGARDGDRLPAGDGRHPADAAARARHAGERQRERPLLAARRADLRRPRRGPGDQHRRDRAAAHDLRHDHAGGGLYVHPGPSPGQPGRLRAVLERRPGHRGNSGRGRRELAVSVRQGTCRRVPDPAVRADHRHPLGGVQDPGRTSAGLVRRAVDHLDLRPVRGELAVFPGAAADHQRRGPDRGAGRGGVPKLEELRLHNGTIYRWNRPVYDIAADSRTSGWRTGCCPRARRWST